MFRRGERFSGRLSLHGFAVLCLCVCTLFLHFMADDVGHFRVWLEAGQLAENEPLGDWLEEHDSSDVFVLPGVASHAASGLLLGIRPDSVCLAAGDSLSPLVPPPRTA